MKKGLAIAVMLLVFAPVFGASAIELDSGTGTETRDVTVGEIDEPIYSVDITWGDMVFDWKYDEGANSFNFRQQRGPGVAVSTTADGYEWLSNEKDKGYIFEDESCKNAFTGEIVSGTAYYHCPIYSASGVVRLTDHSVNGKVKAAASFNASNDYGWVTGRFGLWETNSQGTLVFNESQNGEFQQFVDTNWDGTSTTFTMINLDLQKNREPSSSEIVSTDDVIGTITLSIEPDTD